MRRPNTQHICLGQQIPFIGSINASLFNVFKKHLRFGVKVSILFEARMGVYEVSVKNHLFLAKKDVLKMHFLDTENKEDIFHGTFMLFKFSKAILAYAFRMWKS